MVLNVLSLAIARRCDFQIRNTTQPEIMNPKITTPKPIPSRSCLVSFQLWEVELVEWLMYMVSDDVVQ